MMLNPTERQQLYDDARRLGQTAVGMNPGQFFGPQSNYYGGIAGAGITGGPLSAIGQGFTTLFPSAIQTAGWAAVTFPGQFLGNALKLSNRHIAIGTFNWNGSIGIPGVRPIFETIRGVHDAMFPGQFGNIGRKVLDVGGGFFGGFQSPLEKLIGAGLKGLDNKPISSETIQHIFAKSGMYKQESLAAMKANPFKFWKGLNTDVKGVSGVADDVASSILYRTRILGMAKPILGLAQNVSIGIQAGQAVGNIYGSLVKFGYDASSTLAQRTRELLEKARSTEFAGDISAYVTQAATTERTRALQYMQMSRTNGAYMYGSETNYL